MGCGCGGSGRPASRARSGAPHFRVAVLLFIRALRGCVRPCWAWGLFFVPSLGLSFVISRPWCPGLRHLYAAPRSSLLGGAPPLCPRFRCVRPWVPWASALCAPPPPYLRFSVASGLGCPGPRCFVAARPRLFFFFPATVVRCPAVVCGVSSCVVSSCVVVCCRVFFGVVWCLGVLCRPLVWSAVSCWRCRAVLPCPPPPLVLPLLLALMLLLGPVFRTLSSGVLLCYSCERVLSLVSLPGRMACCPVVCCGLSWCLAPLCCVPWCCVSAWCCAVVPCCLFRIAGGFCFFSAPFWGMVPCCLCCSRCCVLRRLPCRAVLCCGGVPALLPFAVLCCFCCVGRCPVVLPVASGCSLPRLIVCCCFPAARCGVGVPGAALLCVAVCRGALLLCAHLGFYGVQKSQNQLQSEMLLFLSNYTIKSIFSGVSPPPLRNGNFPAPRSTMQA